MSAAELETRLRTLTPGDPERELVTVELAWAIALKEGARARTLSEGLADAEDPRVRAGALRNLGYLEMTSGTVEVGIAHCDEARTLFAALGDAAGQATVEDTLAHLHLQLGAVEVALGHALSGRELAEQTGEPAAIGWALHNLGDVYHALHDLDAAATWYDKALPFFEQASHRVGLARTHARIADLELERGALDTAQTHLSQAVAFWGESEVALGLAHGHAAQAKLDLELSRPDSALVSVERAEQLEVTQPFLLATLQLRKAEALMGLERITPALEAIEVAIGMTTGSELRFLQLEAWGLRAKLLEQRGDLAQANEALRNQLEMSRALAREDAMGRAKSLRIGMEVAAARREAEVTERILLDVLPASVVRDLKLHGRVDPMLCPSATVLFTDLVGFTQISARLDARDLVAELDRLFADFDAISEQYGLEKLKTIGDAYMAVAGLPDPHPHHALRATLAALHLRDVVANAGGPSWSVRIGLHTGPLVAGIIGRAKLAYDIWGDTVNTASRMESSGAPGRVNVSATTHSLVESFFVTESRGAVHAKGKGAIEMFFVDRIRPEHAADEAGMVPGPRLQALLAL